MTAQKRSAGSNKVAAGSKIEETHLRFLNPICGAPTEVRAFGTSRRRVCFATFADHPTAGLTTYVSMGASELAVSMYRGLDVGFELTLTVAGEQSELVDALAGALLENWRLADTGERRRFIEANGIFAPGYPPHFLFTEDLTATPKLLGRKRVGERYASHMAAIPLDDAEARAYDRGIRAFIEQLRSDGRITDYPR